ncbi:MAG: hypothetical protein PVS3B3_08930 [Ktedonobacteraceae bacterium]
MARTKYSNADIARLARRDPHTLTSYERRLVRGYQAGLSRSQARGHARVKYDEQPVSVVKVIQRGLRLRVEQAKPAPKIQQRIMRLPGNGELVTTYKPEVIARSLQRLIREGGEAGKLRRIYFQVWDSKEGAFVSVYQGKRSTSHGITVEEFLRRVDTRMQAGQARDLDEAIRQTINEDSMEGAGRDSPEGEGAPFAFTQLRLYVLPEAIAIAR